MQTSKSMLGMKSCVCLLLLALVACTTKPNPGVCCTTDADCARLGGIEHRGCPDGYACRSLLCEVAECAGASDCSSEQPVCNLDAASCMGCTASSDCSRHVEVPVCDVATGACRACAHDSECASEVCDPNTGHCVAESEVIYASPAGADTAGCTYQQPCSVSRAIAAASADPSSSLVRLLPGAYPTLLIFTSGVVEVVGTDARIQNAPTAQPVEVYDSAVVEIRGLDIGGDISIMGSGNLFPSLTLRDSVVRRGVVMANHGNLRMIRSRVDNGAVAIGEDGSFEADRVHFDGGETGAHLDTPGRRMRVRITNSIFDRAVFSINNQDGYVEKSEYHVAFNTFVFDAQGLNCALSNNPRLAVFENNIFFSSSAQLQSVIFGSGCNLAGNITHPQEPDLGGTNIDQDPRFVSVQGKDYRLQPGSPAVDAAVSSSGAALDHDFAGTPRPQGARKDIGAFELAP